MGLGFEPLSLTLKPSWVWVSLAHTKWRATSYDCDQFSCSVHIWKPLCLLGQCLIPHKGSREVRMIPLRLIKGQLRATA